MCACDATRCTNDIALQPDQMLLCRGKGRVYAKEKDKYHPRVQVAFQKNAWLDKEMGLVRPSAAHIMPVN